MKNSYIILSLLVVCLALQTKADNQILPPIITVSGTAEVKTPPTEAVVSIAVEQRQKSVQQLRRQVDYISTNVIAYLQKQGIEIKDIQTSYINVYPYYSQSTTGTGSTSPDYYVGSKALTFILKQLDTYDVVMAGLYDLGLNRVDGITFRIPDETANRTEAKRLAVINAKETATIMATELGVTLGNVYSISDGSYSPPAYPVPMMAREFMAADSVSSISGGQNSYTSTVTVSFYINQ